MTMPGVFKAITGLHGGLKENYILKEDIYIKQEELTDPFIGPNETTNDGDPSQLFFSDPQMYRQKFSFYMTQTNQYRGTLPADYRYHLGSSGPDKVINLDNPPRPGSSQYVEWQARLKVTPIPSLQLATFANPNVRGASTSAKNIYFNSVVYNYPMGFGSFETFIDYDPSNGLFSDGDIHLLGP